MQLFIDINMQFNILAAALLTSCRITIIVFAECGDCGLGHEQHYNTQHIHSSTMYHCLTCCLLSPVTRKSLNFRKSPGVQGGSTMTGFN